MRISDWSSDVCSSDLVALGSALTCEVRRKRFILVGDTIEDHAWIYQQPQPLVRPFESQRCPFAPADLGMIADSALDPSSDLVEFLPRGISRIGRRDQVLAALMNDVESPAARQRADPRRSYYPATVRTI